MSFPHFFQNNFIVNFLFSFFPIKNATSGFRMDAVLSIGPMYRPLLFSRLDGLGHGRKRMVHRPRDPLKKIV
jgi:hypothetical protein